MPTNLAEIALGALKVGNDNVTAAHVGHQQIFPNSVEITSWTGQEGRTNYPSGGGAVGTYTTSVTGPVGATFNLVGTNGAIGQTGLVKAINGAENFDYGISSNETCDTGQRTVSLALVATGNTTLANPLGGRPNPDTGGSGNPAAIQVASPYSTQTISISGTWTITEIQKNTVTVGGSLRFAAGTIYDFTYTTGTITNSAGANAGVGVYNFTVQPTAASGFAATISNISNTMGLTQFPPGAIYFQGGQNVTPANQSNKSFSWRYEITDSSGFQPSSISYNANFYDTGLTGNGGCYTMSPSQTGSQYIYP